MPSLLPSIADLICNDFERLALPSNVRYGRAIHDRGGVVFLDLEPYALTAQVGGLDGSSKTGGGQRRRVAMTSTDAGLQWRCTGNPKDHEIFCKHCVAVALALNEQRASAG